MACVKVYLCSNPEDSVTERKVLRDRAFPKLRDHCRRTYGVDLRVIDPYEETNSDNWPTQEVRLKLIEECRNNSPGPYFVGLVGAQYGSACLPEQVELSEFLSVLRVCQQMGFGSEILKKCYRRDENSVPPSFCLLNRVKYNRPDSEEEGNNWDDVRVKVRKILDDVVTQCVLEGSINQQQSQKYFRSALENDLRFALDGRSASDIRRCLCYVYKTNIKDTERVKGNLPAQSDQLGRLCNDFLPNLVTTHGALVFTTTNTTTSAEVSDGKQSYAEELSQQLYSDLVGLLAASNLKNKAQTHDQFSQQRSLCRVLSSLCRIERAEVVRMKAYLEQDTKYPLILIGGPCTGKSVLMAHCATQIKTWMKDQDPVVIVEFTDKNSSLNQVLGRICHQIALCHNQTYSACLKGKYQLKEDFNNLLTTNSLSPSHLILIMDGLDQIHDMESPPDIAWLPKTLPSNVKIVISTTPKRSGFLSAMRAYYPESCLFFELESLDSKSCSQMLTTRLLESNRKITSGQQMFVNQAFKKCSLPLYVELLHRQVCFWDSELEITPDTLVPGVHANIGRFLERLEERHGRTLVARTLGYLTLSRFGLTEAELTDVLSCDDEVLPAFLLLGNCKPYKLRVPEVAVERLLLDLKGFLVPQNTMGIQTLVWVSRHFISVISKRYLGLHEQQQQMHSLMASYFSGRWSCGTAKPLFVSDHRKNETETKIYTDRQVPGQPWLFQPAHPNLRKLQELPFHLTKSGKLDELLHTMTSLDFLQTMSCAGLGEELIVWMDKTSRIVSSRELRFLVIVLKSSSCLLRACPADLTLLVRAKMTPFFQVFPVLDEASFQSELERIGVNMVLSPTPSVPASHGAPTTIMASPIMKAAKSQSGLVVVIQNDGSAWVCNGSDSEFLKLARNSDLEFTDVRCSADLFILTTRSGNFMTSDLNNSLDLQELHKHNTESINGIAVANGKIFAFSKGRSSVSVFADGKEIAPLECSYCVTCITSGDGRMIYCGQNQGTVSVFDSKSGNCLMSFTCSTGVALFDLLVRENGNTIMCVDCTGSVFLWDAVKSRLVKEIQSSTKNDVLNVDRSERTLLICKRPQIEIICEDSLEFQDQFNTPKCKTFVQAVLDHEAHFIIALMEDCPFLLVWNRVSGQCVLNLATETSQAFTLIKDDTYLMAVTSTGIVKWDMDLISVAASIPKCGDKIARVIVEPCEEFFYTMDGSETVCKWTVCGGKVEGHFVHQGPVEAVALSEDGLHVVSVASGDIYVWNTNTNENILRIHGSQASRVLTAPSCSLAVALSETGPSKVWRLCTGHVVCSIHHHLRNAIISPESTFLLGINRGNLLAVSLWSGCVSKRFSSTDGSEVVAFRTLSDYPDYVILLTGSGAVFSWRLTEDTVCHQFLIPESLRDPPPLFKLSSDGHYGIVSVTGPTINIVDTYHGKLCTLDAEGPVCQPFVDISGKYAVFICDPPVVCRNYSCDVHKKTLVVIRLTDGKRVGKFYLCNTPCALTLSKKLCVYVGFEDGSVGVYAVNDAGAGHTTDAKYQSSGCMCPFEEPVVWAPLVNPNLTWESLIRTVF